MRKRRRMSRKKSRRSFSRTASRTHKFNMNSTKFMMRGGIRM